MKKILSLILALTMILSLAACGGSNDDAAEENDAPVSGEIENVEDVENAEGEVDEQPAEDAEQPAADPNETPAVTPEQKPAETQKPAQSETGSSDAASGTVASALKTQFQTVAGGAAADVATALCGNEVVAPIGVMAMPVEPGLLTGFDNYEVNGFKEGAVFMPMIGSIAFVGYVFTLEDGADVNAFMENLKANCNPRWNICVTADETLVTNVGNQVLFVMCPSTIEA